MTSEGAGELEALVRLMSPPTEPRDAGDPERWPQIELRLGRRLPSDYKAFVATYGSGRVGEFLNVANPFSDNPHVRDLPGEMLQVYRDIRKFEHIPFPIHPEPGGLIPWGDTDNGDVLFWVADPPDDPDRWSIAVSEVRGPGWFVHPGPLVRFLREWTTGSAVIPFMGDPPASTFEPAEPWEELEARLEANAAKWRAWPGHPSPPGPPGPRSGEWPPTTTDGWIDALQNGSGQGRDLAQEHLASLGAQILPRLIALLDEDSPTIWVVRAILGTGEAAVPALLELYERRGGRLHWPLAHAMGLSHDERALAPLLRSLASDDELTRAHAAEGLRLLGRAEAVMPLVATLDDPYSHARRESVIALGEIGEVGARDVADAVKARLGDAVDWVRAPAAKAYGRLGGAAAVELLGRFLADGVRDVRVGAIEGLGETGSPDAATILLDRLPTLDPRMPVREELGATITALGRLRDERARAPLEAALEATYRDWKPTALDPTFGELATAALAALDAPDDGEP
jgi:HEAT repeat protein